MLDELEQVGDEPNERALIDLDQRIHRHVYECAHNAFLEATLNEYYVLTPAHLVPRARPRRALEDAVTEHRELLQAIRDGDADAGREAMRPARRASRTRSGACSDRLYIPTSNSYISRSECMSTLPRQARAVVIGCGIVGNSVAYHLTDQGWSDVVLLDKGPLPNPGGSTGHASNFIFPVDHSKEMTQLTLESVRQYEEMGVFTESGGIEVARPRSACRS